MSLIYRKNAIVSITKEFTFDSCHYLNNYVGNCANLHGHTYKLQITLTGSLDDRGILVDFKELKKDVQEKLLEILDHDCLNEVFFFNPTAENMAIWIYDDLNLLYKNRNFKVSEVKLWETPTSFATYKGEINNA